MSIGAIASGPSLGIFTMGMLIPFINARVSWSASYIKFLRKGFNLGCPLWRDIFLGVHELVLFANPGPDSFR